MNLSDYGPLNLLTALILADAEGEPLEGKVAVAWVVRNRIADKRWPSTCAGVILQDKQFSCLNDGNARRPVFMGALLPSQGGNFRDPIWRECRFVAHGVLHDWLRDPTGGANHYNTLDCDPSYEKKMTLTKVIGNHEFFKG